MGFSRNEFVMKFDAWVIGDISFVSLHLPLELLIYMFYLFPFHLYGFCPYLSIRGQWGTFFIIDVAVSGEPKPDFRQKFFFFKSGNNPPDEF
jgi:hypothetical protein